MTKKMKKHKKGSVRIKKFMVKLKNEREKDLQVKQHFEGWGGRKVGKKSLMVFRIITQA